MAYGHFSSSPLQHKREPFEVNLDMLALSPDIGTP